MDLQHHHKVRDKDEEKQGEGKIKQEGKDGQQVKQPPPPPPLQTTTASPPSASSSPSHEFSFTISLHPPASAIPDKAKTPSSISVDLSPADEIFFHGHLLPLHLLSHLPASPRSSTNSLDSFTLPIKELLEDQNPNKISTSNHTNHIGSDNYHQKEDDENKGRTKSKSKSFKLFGLSKWRKGCDVREKEDKERHKRKLRFDVSHILKRYMRLVRPILPFRGRRENMQLQRQPRSFSGNLSLKGQQELRGRRGEFSAPASMRTSPTNSGLLLATGTLPTSTSESTLEELQAAVQAAIAHCKNSIAMEEKVKCQD